MSRTVDVLRRHARVIAVVAALVVVGAGGYWLGSARAPASGAQAGDGQRVLYWYDPMRPDVHFDEPGQSPFMSMPLVPRYAEEAREEAGVRIDPGIAQNFGVRTALVERGVVERTIRGAGAIAFSERSRVVVQSRASGFVERAYGRAVGDVVQAGAPIVDVRVPEWTAAQAEYLALRGAGGELADAARQRLAMLGMPASLIARVEREGRPRPVATITAPITGAITELDIRAGMTVMKGAPLATINGLSPVWLIVSLPQAQAGVASRGGRVIARASAYPGETFAGRIESVLPAADPGTRTVEVRVALANADGRLRPGMTAEAELSETGAHETLLAPAEAVIQTGRRTVIIVAEEGGRYVPRAVEVGRRAGDRIEIRQGLNEGERVVASGQFLIDSEASLLGALERLEASAAQEAPQAAHAASGRIAAIEGTQISIAHGPIATLNWPAMTMAFSLRDERQVHGLAVGDQVTFRFVEEGGRYLITEISKAGGAP